MELCEYLTRKSVNSCELQSLICILSEKYDVKVDLFDSYIGCNKIIKLYGGLFEFESIQDCFYFLLQLVEPIVHAEEEAIRKERYLRSALVDSLEVISKKFDKTVFTVSLSKNE